MPMCGICGMIGLENDTAITEKMLKTMGHRGPDGQGRLTVPNCCLLHTRLAIIDPTGGQQPMTYRHGQQQYAIVYNGELYNTEEIRNDLLRLGHAFTGHSDTEVVLHAYAQWQEKCLERMNGIFAFGIWDYRAQRLFLARDRIGVKPLFYKEHQGGLLFASEIKTILAYPTVEAKLDAQGCGQILLLGPGRIPGSGVFHGIRELEPGQYGFYENGKLLITRYWYLQDREHRDTFEQTAEKVRYLVTDAIKRQMVSDVPIGTFLSGGLDSSLITAICAKEQATKGNTLPTFSVDYRDNDKYFTPGKFQPNSDPYYIRIMEKALPQEHHWTVLTPEDLYDALEQATIARDLPGMADVDFSLLCFCREIRRCVKVALSGECADEIFGGYPWYRDPDVRALDGFPWAQNTAQRCGLLADRIKQTLNPIDFVNDLYRDTCTKSDILPQTSPQERRMKEMMNLNFRWFMQTLLDRKDRMSMFCGLEVRVPFCDYRIAEYLYGVPWEFKDYQGNEKGLLRYAMKGILPDEILWRKKSPYPKTFDPQYGEIMQAGFSRLLQAKDSPIYEMVNREALAKLAENSGPWPWYGQLMRTPQTMAFFLQTDFWLRYYNIDFMY